MNAPDIPDTQETHRGEIAFYAHTALANHILEEVGPRQWRCWDTKTGFYAFRVAELPGLIATWGDVGTLVVDAGGAYNIDWLRGSIAKSRDYVLSKCSLEKKTHLLEGTFRDWAEKTCTPEEIAAAEDYGWDMAGWNKVSTMVFERTGDAEKIGSVFDYDSRVHWCCEALCKFVELYNRGEADRKLAAAAAAKPRRTKKKGG